MSGINNYQTSFIEENVDVEFDESIKKFVTEMKSYFQSVWSNHKGLILLY